MVWWSRARHNSESGKWSTTWFIVTETQGKGLAFWRWFMKHLPNTGKQTVILGVGGKVNKPRLHVLMYPGKPSVCLGLMAKWPCL